MDVDVYENTFIFNIAFFSFRTITNPEYIPLGEQKILSLNSMTLPFFMGKLLEHQGMIWVVLIPLVM